jgi:hypothetical protein
MMWSIVAILQVIIAPLSTVTGFGSKKLVVSFEAAPCGIAIEVTVAAEELEAITELLLLLPVVAPVFPEIARSSSSLLFPGPEFLEPGPRSYWSRSPNFLM